MRTPLLICTLCLAGCLIGGPAQAQPRASLVVEVVDTTGGFLPSAAVTLKKGADTIAEVTVNETGVATLNAPPGSYQIVVKAEAFEAHTETVQVTQGRPRRMRIELSLSGLTETVTVAAESATPAESTVSAEEIAALSDDPEALNDFIRDVGGAGADVRVDGFEGGRMPPKEQVAQVIVISDPYSAQFHSVGQNQVNVITRPGFGKWHRSANMNFGNDSLAARNPFASEKLPFQSVYGWFSASGPIKRLRTSVSMDLNVRRANEVLPTVAFSQAGLVRSQAQSQNDRQSFEIRFTNAVGKNAILRNRVEAESTSRAGAGLGELDLPERAYSSASHRVNFRSSLNNKLRHGINQEIRVFGEWQSTRQQPLTEALGINVLGAFRSGGAQTRGTLGTRNAQIEGNWTFPTKNRHAFRAGTLLEDTYRNSSNLSNYLGTFVFAGLDAYQAGLPITYTRRTGSADIAVNDLRGSVYAQDEIRLTKTLQLGLGMREEWQPSIDDEVNLSPRAALAYVSKKKTTLRFGVGQFYSWHDMSLLEEARRLDGNRFTEIVIQNPGYPDPFLGGTTQASLPSSRVVTSDGLVVSRHWRASVTFEKRVGPLSLRATTNRQIGADEPRSRNLNVPVYGVRPDPTLGNVLLLASMGRSQRTGFEVNANAGNLWHRRVFTSFQYSFNEFLNDADSPLSLPADSLHPEREWGPSRGDVRHRAWGSISLRIPNSFNAGLNVRWQTASPYNITTGQDTNGDTVTNDRPDGVGRNSVRGVGFWVADLRLGWTRRLSSRPALQRQGQGPGPRGATQGPEAGFTVGAYNLFNKTQYGSFTGVLTSPLFGLPTSAFNPRRIDLSMHVRF